MNIERLFKSYCELKSETIKNSLIPGEQTYIEYLAKASVSEQHFKDETSRLEHEKQIASKRNHFFEQLFRGWKSEDILSLKKFLSGQSSEGLITLSNSNQLPCKMSGDERFFLLKEMQKGPTQAEIEFDVKLHYGQDYEDLQNKVPVLIYEYFFKNLSKSETYTISTWSLNAGIASISPAKNYKTYSINSGIGMAAPPTKEQLVVLKPGETHKIKSWYWAKSDLPWTNLKRTEGYLLTKSTPLDLIFCAELSDASEAFSGLGIKNIKFTTGKFCAKQIHFAFQILTTD